ncbi:D123-domain-containing protein [Boletus edulis]|nr:D123-domain-containing protein [Boletus edulis]
MFPQFNASYILAFQFSSWFPSFSSMSIRSTIIRPLDQSFKSYLESDGVFVPEGSEDAVAESTLSDEDESESSDKSEPEGQHFSFPELDAAIRDAIDKYQAVFPKLNFSSPKDAAWVLPMSSPLRCTSPADVYLLLKSSDFVTYDLNTGRVFEGCGTDDRPSYDLELVLRKWYPMDRSREVRCFVRNDILLGIAQRDMNFYDYMTDPGTQTKIKSAVCRLWEEKIRLNWTLTQPDYVFDLLLTRDLSRGHILDFNPYAPRTDPLLFSYEELHGLLIRATREPDGSTCTIDLPELRVVDSPMHPAAARSTPAHQHNMVPIEALSLSEGKSIIEFSEIWRDEVKRAMQDEDKDYATHESSD